LPDENLTLKVGKGYIRGTDRYGWDLWGWRLYQLDCVHTHLQGSPQAQSHAAEAQGKGSRSHMGRPLTSGDLSSVCTA